MRSLLYLSVVLALALGLVCGGAYAAFLLSMLFAALVAKEFLPWVFGITLAGFVGWVLYYTSRVIAGALRRGPPPAFRGWRYGASAACVVLFLLNMLAVATPALASEASRFLGFVSYLPLSYVPVMLLAFVALPSISS